MPSLSRRATRTARTACRAHGSGGAFSATGGSTGVNVTWRRWDATEDELGELRAGIAAALRAAGLEVHELGTRIFVSGGWPGGRRASDLTTPPWPGLLHAEGAVYSLIHEGQDGGPVRGCRGGGCSGRGQLGAAAGPAAPGSHPDGAGFYCISPCGVRAGAACRATGRARACTPLPPSLTCPGSQGPSAHPWKAADLPRRHSLVHSR